MYAWESPVRIYLSLLLFFFVSLGNCSELRVRVRLSGGLIAEEMLEADNEKDAITVEFKQGDGTHITVVFDFKRDVRIFKALILGEPEQGQNQYQVLCFVTRLDHHEIIPSESMARLRQNNPHLVRTAEEKRGVEYLQMDLAVNLSQTGHLDTNFHDMCKEAHEGVYTRTVDVKHWFSKGRESSVFEAQPHTSDVDPVVQRCPSTRNPWQPCTCSFHLRLEWVPCLLKYCHSRRVAPGRANPYKCGIRSCSKGYHFDYSVPHRLLCPWDEDT
ncbi:out at first protein homolog [Osmerus mordax]|uniref:out at first protein homolog n=1 Tax=Osmerus mordax TaxID=8014 RepID=UPI00350F78CC